MNPQLSAEQKEHFIREGYLVMRGLIPPDLASTTRESLLKAMEIDPNTPETWKGKNLTSDLSIIRMTACCRTDGVESVAEQLVGPHFVRGLAQSPYLESRGVSPSLMPGYIPVLNFPSPGAKEFERPPSYHIDGMHLTTLFPVKHYLVVFAYLTDVAEYGGATAICPGSHRQVFTHWVRENHPGSTCPPKLDFADPVPMTGRAGDVIFMHYLTVHSGSANHSDQIRVGLNTAVLPDENHPYTRKQGTPQPDWTPLDYTLRTDIGI